MELSVRRKSEAISIRGSGGEENWNFRQFHLWSKIVYGEVGRGRTELERDAEIQ